MKSLQVIYIVLDGDLARYVCSTVYTYYSFTVYTLQILQYIKTNFTVYKYYSFTVYKYFNTLERIFTITQTKLIGRLLNVLQRRHTDIDEEAMLCFRSCQFTHSYYVWIVHSYI